jgi:DNA-binding GntR family transcriptional regulator
MDLVPIPGANLAAGIVEQLRDRIALEVFKPGEQLNETRIAEALGVSRGPVREAFSQLSREHLLTARRNRPVVVRELTDADVEEVYTVRLVLERLAVSRAARLVGASGVAELDQLIRVMARSARHGTEQDCAHADLAFHEVIYRVARHERLLHFWEELRGEVYVLLLRRNVISADYRRIVESQHRTLRDAITSGDADRAVAEVEQHLRDANTRLMGRAGESA